MGVLSRGEFPQSFSASRDETVRRIRKRSGGARIVRTSTEALATIIIHAAGEHLMFVFIFAFCPAGVEQ